MTIRNVIGISRVIKPFQFRFGVCQFDKINSRLDQRLNFDNHSNVKSRTPCYRNANQPFEKMYPKIWMIQSNPFERDIEFILFFLQDAKDVVNSSKLWKRLQPMMSSSGNNSPSKKSDSDDLSSFKLRKVWEGFFVQKESNFGIFLKDFWLSLGHLGQILNCFSTFCLALIHILSQFETF